MNDETPDSEPQADAAPANTVAVESSPPKLQPPDPRQRLRQLLSVPERNRTDAMWDEIVELEIQTSPANRAQPQQGNSGQRQEPGRKPDQSKRQQPPSGGKQGKRFFNKGRRGPGKAQ